MAYRAWSSNGGPRILRVPSWQIALILVVALAVGLAIAVVATGIFLIALPVAIVAGLAYRLFGKRRGASRRGDAIVEGEYEVVSSRPAAHPYRRES